MHGFTSLVCLNLLNHNFFKQKIEAGPEKKSDSESKGVWLASLTSCKLPVFSLRSDVFLSWACPLHLCAWLMDNSLWGVSKTLSTPLVKCPRKPTTVHQSTHLPHPFPQSCLPAREAYSHHDGRLRRLPRCKLPGALNGVMAGTWTRNLHVPYPPKASSWSSPWKLSCSVNSCLYGLDS